MDAAADVRTGMPAWRLRALMLAAAFLAALYLRSPLLLTAPRMWAEEATFYYAALQDGAASAWTLVVRGNYQLLANLALGAAVRVPAQWAAHVTTAWAAAIALLNMVLLAVVSAERRWPGPVPLLVAVALALLPAGYELYLTSTNAQWLCSVSLLLLALARVDRWTPAGRTAAVAWTLLCGLTGVPGAMLAPALLAVAWLRRSRMHAVLGGIVAACALAQMAVIVTHPLEGRAFALDGFVMVISALLQSVAIPLAGVDAGAVLVSWLRAGAATPTLLLMLVAACVLPLAAACLRLRRSPEGAVDVVVLAGAAVVASTLNMVGAIGDLDEMVSTYAGGRYFYLATVCWLLISAQLASSAGWPSRVLATLALAACVAAGASGVGKEQWNGFVAGGPSWQASVARCHDRRPCQVQVWPGAYWTFTLTRP